MQLTRSRPPLLTMTLMIILYYIILYSFSDNCIQPDDGQIRNGRNMQPTKSRPQLLTLTLVIILHYIILYSFSDNCFQRHDGQIRNGRNMQLTRSRPPPTTHNDTDDYIVSHYTYYIVFLITVSNLSIAKLEMAETCS